MSADYAAITNAFGLEPVGNRVTPDKLPELRGAVQQASSGLQNKLWALRELMGVGLTAPLEQAHDAVNDAYDQLDGGIYDLQADLTARTEHIQNLSELIDDAGKALNIAALQQSRDEINQRSARYGSRVLPPVTLLEAAEAMQAQRAQESEHVDNIRELSNAQKADLRNAASAEAGHYARFLDRLVSRGAITRGEATKVQNAAAQAYVDTLNGPLPEAVES